MVLSQSIHVWRRMLSAAAFCCLAAGLAAHSARAAETELHIARDNTALSIHDGNRPVLRYRCVESPMKPYAYELYSPAGVQVLRDSPEDHKHHHGLMFAVAVDAVDFWIEDNANRGRQQNKSLVEKCDTSSEEVARAGLVQELEWIGPESNQPLLLEKREVDVIRDKDIEATLVEWRSRLQAPPDRLTVTLSGQHYFGLGLRFVVSMDNSGQFMYADGKEGEIVRGDERLTPARWCAYAAKADGKPVTVALFDHPANPRHPAEMFTMKKPFAYLSATLNLSHEPLILKADAPIELCYGIALWDGMPDSATIERLYRRWSVMSSAKRL